MKSEYNSIEGKRGIWFGFSSCLNRLNCLHIYLIKVVWNYREFPAKRTFNFTLKISMSITAIQQKAAINNINNNIVVGSITVLTAAADTNITMEQMTLLLNAKSPVV